jgi:hypothetical protein
MGCKATGKRLQTGCKTVVVPPQLTKGCARGDRSGGPAGSSLTPRERRRNLVLVCDQGCDAVGALPTQVLLAGAHERQADAATTVISEHDEPVHVPPPAVPRGDQRAHERAVGIGDEQAPGCLGEQPVDIFDPVGSRCVRTARPLPQVENRRRLGGLGGANGVFLLAQADTVAEPGPSGSRSATLPWPSRRLSADFRSRMIASVTGRPAIGARAH